MQIVTSRFLQFAKIRHFKRKFHFFSRGGGLASSPGGPHSSPPTKPPGSVCAYQNASQIYVYECQSVDGHCNHCSQPEKTSHWPRPLFIQYWTPDGRGAAPFTTSPIPVPCTNHTSELGSQPINPHSLENGTKLVCM